MGFHLFFVVVFFFELFTTLHLNIRSRSLSGPPLIPSTKPIHKSYRDASLPCAPATVTRGRSIVRLPVSEMGETRPRGCGSETKIKI